MKTMWTSAIGYSVGLGLVFLFAKASVAAPALIWTSTDLGGGLTSYSVSIDGQDGLLQSFYVEIEFEGAINHSQFFGMEVDYEIDALTNDGSGGFDITLDSFFDNFVWSQPGPPLFGVDQTATTFAFSGGTGPLSIFEVAHLAQIVATGEVDFTAEIGRDAVLYQVSGTIPEPGAAALLAAGLLLLASDRRRG